MIYDMLDAQLFLQPGLQIHKEHSITCSIFNYFLGLSAYLTGNRAFTPKSIYMWRVVKTCRWIHRPTRKSENYLPSVKKFTTDFCNFFCDQEVQWHFRETNASCIDIKHTPEHVSNYSPIYYSFKKHFHIFSVSPSCSSCIACLIKRWQKRKDNVEEKD